MTRAEKKVIGTAMRWSRLVGYWEQNESPNEYEYSVLNDAENAVHDACAALAKSRRKK